MIKNKKVKLFILVNLFAVAISATAVIARPISNTLRATISVLSTNVTVGDGIEFDYNTINQAIEKVNTGGVVRIKSGVYNIDSITSKDVTLQSYDGGYVDIITTTAIPQDTKLKIGDKVTVNQEGVDPVKVLSKAIVSGVTTTLSENELVLNAKQGDTINILLNEKIINRLGFNNVDVMLKVNNSSGVNIEKTLNGVKEAVEAQSSGIYNLGDVEAGTNNMLLTFTFTRGGEYILELWADDGR